MGGVTAWANPEYDTAKVPALFNEYNAMIKDITAVPIYDACMDASVIETMNCWSSVPADWGKGT